MHLPVLDRFLILLDSQTLHPLIAPSHAGQQTSDLAGHITLSLPVVKGITSKSSEGSELLSKG